MRAGESRPVPLERGWSLWPVVALRSAGMPFELLDRFAVPELLEAPPGEDRDARLRRAATEAVAAAVRDDGVLEALVWQNPEIVDTWLGSYVARLAAGDGARLSNRAYREGLVARYVQRYCAKNESIGFFGPVAWARWAPAEKGVLQSGDGGVRRRSVHLETWAIAALAESWARDDLLLPHLPVRLDPAHSVVDRVLRRPRRPPVECGPVTAAVLAAVDGKRVWGDVVVAAAGATADEWCAELARLRAEGVLQVGFRVPHHHRPEALLRHQVEQVRDPQVRADLLERVDRIVSARDAVEGSRGAEPVRAALGELAARFGAAGCPEAAGSRRRLFGRTVAYLDCRRDTDVLIGGDLLDELRVPLGVLLDAARWLSNELAAGLADGIRERYHHLRQRRAEVTLSDLLFAVGDLLKPAGPVATEVLADFQLRWSELLPRRPVGEIRLDTATVRPLADVLFPPAPVRWTAARQHSPDLMLSRTADGRMRWVVGELHVGLNTLESRLFSTLSDDPDDLVARTEADLPHGRVVPLYPLTETATTSRTYPPPSLDPPGHYRYWSYDSDAGHPSGTASVAGTDILVHEHDGELVGRPRGQRWAAPVREFFGEFLTATVVNLFQIRPRRSHLERVLLDDVVVCRESWSFPVTEVPVPPPGRRLPDRAHRTIREWAAALGMPRHVFVRTPSERKPVYVDFCSPLLVGNLVRAVRRELAEPGTRWSRFTGGSGGGPPAVDIVEMLPGPDELWLTDAGGRRYTAEFRMVAVDGAPAPRVFLPPVETTPRRTGSE
jgi:hypothetical protein